MTATAKSMGMADSTVALVEPAAVNPAQPESALQQVGDRMYNLNLGGSTPAAAIDVEPSDSEQVASLTTNAVKKKAVTRRVVDLPVAKTFPAAEVDAASSQAPVVKASRVSNEVMAKAMKMAKAPKVAAVAPVVGSPTTMASAPEAIKKRAVKKPVVKTAKAMPRKKVRAKRIRPRRLAGLVIVGPSKEVAAQVSKHLVAKGLRGDVAKPSTLLAPLTEIHYRPGHEKDVAAISSALPVKAYAVSLAGLPAGVNVKVVVGNDLRSKL